MGTEVKYTEEDLEGARKWCFSSKRGLGELATAILNLQARDAGSLYRVVAAVRAEAQQASHDAAEKLAQAADKMSEPAPVSGFVRWVKVEAWDAFQEAHAAYRKEHPKP